KIEVEMLGFAPKTEEIGVAPNAPSPAWDLKLLSAADLKASLSAPPAAEAPKPAAPAAQTPNPAAPAGPATNATAQPPARLQQNNSRLGGDRPSIRGAQQQAQAGGR